MKLLLIDDQQSAFTTLKKLLAGNDDLGFEFEWAADFETGLQIIDLWKPDTTLLDLNLGPNFLADKTISSIPLIADKTCVIAITALEDKRRLMWAQCLEAGAANFLQKEHYFNADVMTRKSLIHAIFNSAKYWKENQKRHESKKDT